MNLPGRPAAFAVLAVLAATSCRKDAPVDAERVPPAASAGGETTRARLVVNPKLLESGRITLGAATLSTPGDSLAVTGQVTAPPDGAAEVGAPIAGLIREIRVREGDAVAKDAVLATLDAAEVARTATDLGRAEARLDRATRVLQQEEQLMKESATSERRLAEARSELSAAQAEARGARALLSTFGASGGGRVVVKSPIAGTVVRRTVVLGKPVEAGALLFRIVNASRLLVRADVPENDAADVHPGSAAELSWASRGTRCPATVQNRSPSVDPVTRTVPFLVQPGEGCPELVEGGFVDVTLPHAAPDATRMISVPRDAVVELDGVPVVFVPGSAPGEYRVATVRLARATATTAYLDEGLADGAPVVVRGAILLKGELMRAALE